MSASFFGIVHLPTYLVGTILVILLPGPNSLFVLSTAARRGVRLGYRAACGVFIGDSLLMTLASIGIASILKANPTVFLILKTAGGAYLGYLGINMMITAWKGRGVPSSAALTIPTAEIPPAPAGDPLLRALGHGSSRSTLRIGK